MPLNTYTDIIAGLLVLLRRNTRNNIVIAESQSAFTRVRNVIFNLGMGWTDCTGRCEVMKLRFALLGMNIDLSQGRLGLSSPASTYHQPPPGHHWLLLVRNVLRFMSGEC